MATFDKEIKSNRLLQSKRYTVQNIDGQEAYTNVLDLNSSEIYTQQNLLPTSSLPYSSSAQDGSYITSGSSNIAQYYWRTRLTPTNATVDSSGNSGGNLAQAWVPISGSDYNPTSLQSVASGQIVNWISNKYIQPNLNTLQADVLASGDTPGYNVVLFKNTVSNDPDNAEIVPGTEYQFDYKTGVIQFTSPADAPNKIHYLYLSGYVYLGKTLADETFGSTFNTSSLLITASATNNTIEFTKGDGNAFTITVDTGSAGNPFPFTGSALITGSLGVTGSINATSITSSFQGDLAGKATQAGYAFTAKKLVVAAQGAGDLDLAGNLTASNMSASGHISASNFHGTASLATTSSFAISASYAVSASVEIIKEISSSHADVADVANGLQNSPSIAVTNITASGPISSSEALFISASENSTVDKVALYNDTTGQLFYTASSAIGGGGTAIKATGSGLDGGSPGGDISTITIQDYDTNVVVQYNAGDLKFIFGEPAVPTPSIAESGFQEDRFNLELQTYTVTGTFGLGGYSLISASLFSGSTLLETGDSGLTLSRTFTNVTGEIAEATYTLQLTSSNPVTSTEDEQLKTLNLGLNKSNPVGPSFDTLDTSLVEDGVISDKIEYNATGSISYTGSKSGTDNNWTFVSMSSNVTYAPIAENNSPISGSVLLSDYSADADITLRLTSHYNSAALNNPIAYASIDSSDQIYERTRSVRTAMFPQSQTGSFESDYFNISLLEKSGSINRGTEDPNNLSVTLSNSNTSEGLYQYILIDNTYTLSAIKIGGTNYLDDTFSNGPFDTTSGWKIYKSRELGNGTITYLLET